MQNGSVQLEVHVQFNSLHLVTATPIRDRSSDPAVKHSEFTTAVGLRFFQLPKRVWQNRKLRSVLLTSFAQIFNQCKVPSSETRRRVY